MKVLNTQEVASVNGGVGSFILQYIAGMALDKFFEAAAEVDDLYMDTSLSLPYNRL